MRKDMIIKIPKSETPRNSKTPRNAVDQEDSSPTSFAHSFTTDNYSKKSNLKKIKTSNSSEFLRDPKIVKANENYIKSGLEHVKIFFNEVNAEFEPLISKDINYLSKHYNECSRYLSKEVKNILSENYISPEYYLDVRGDLSNIVNEGLKNAYAGLFIKLNQKVNGGCCVFTISNTTLKNIANCIDNDPSSFNYEPYMGLVGDILSNDPDNNESDQRIEELI